ncbi:tetraacyldisaccharide 4'-kinase [Verrucomicrobia bacterium LW23]|nr:tetraacyldisaccharide 4'-kinase [Verrucomicrobia bacterium LW23]
MAGKSMERLEEFAVDVILERRYGKRAALLRLVLWMLSGLYRRIMELRVWMYEERYYPVHALGCMVISVGNLTVGGTGKTPVVEKFARELTKNGRKVAILSRGYKSYKAPLLKRLWHRFLRGGDPTPPRVVCDGRSLLLDSAMAGDEPFMLAQNLHDVVVLVGKDRVKSGMYAIQKFGCDTLLLDDGYQYLPLKERFDVLLVDVEAPYGNNYMLPRGMLREPPEHLKRADIIFLTKCNGSDMSVLKKDLRQYNKHARFIECTHTPLYLEDLMTGQRVELDVIKGMRVGAVSGIARPESFEDGLKRLGVDLLYSKRFADHHRFSAQEIEQVLQRTKARGGRAVITTEKDAVRFPRRDKCLLPIYFLRVEIKILQGEEIFHKCVRDLCEQYSCAASPDPEEFGAAPAPSLVPQPQLLGAATPTPGSAA